MQILVVEDHEDTRNVLTRFFSRCGYDVSGVDNLREGLELLQASFYDVIISDIALPDGTGYALMSEARKRGVTSLAIALSAYDFPKDVEEEKITGFDYHVQKPFDCGHLRSLLPV